jgi:hypothetical protein
MALARVTINMTWFGQVVQNVLHFWNGEGAYDAAAVKFAIETLWIPPIRPLQLGSLNYFKIQVRRMDVIGGLTTDFAVNINGSSGSAVEGWGPLCMLWSLSTATGGHAGKGRIYLPGSYPGNVVQGRFISALMDQMNTAAATIGGRFLGAGATSGFQLAVCKRENLPVVHPVTSIIPRQVPGIQRRRNIGVGM